MKHKFLILALFSVSLLSCKKYLDINSDPDTPQNPDPTSVFPTLIANIPGGGGERGTGGVQSDALWIGSYIQFWHSRTNDAGVIGQADWDRMAKLILVQAREWSIVLMKELKEANGM